MMPSTRTRRASRSKSTSPSIPRLRNNSKRSILCLTTVVLLDCVVVTIKDDAVVSFWLHRFFYTTSRYSTKRGAPDPLTMVAVANGHGSVIDDADVVSMTVTTSPRRSTFLQQARWDAVQKAKLEGMSIRQMARELGLHRDTVRRYIDAETPPMRRSPATLPASTSDTIPQ